MLFSLKELFWYNTTDHRSMNSKISTLHGRSIAIKVHHFEWACLQVSKTKSDLAFLKRCRDSSIIPSFAKIKNLLNNPRNHWVLLVVILALVHSQISKIRKNIDFISRRLLSLHLELSNVIFVDLWTRIDAYFALNSLCWEEIWKRKQYLKFLKLSKNSSPPRGFTISLNNKFDGDQISALCS